MISEFPLFVFTVLTGLSAGAYVGAALFLGGTLGNLWDRVQTGLVIDFFDFRVWPVFNVADIAICVGVGLILWGMVENGFPDN